MLRRPTKKSERKADPAIPHTYAGRLASALLIVSEIGVIVMKNSLITTMSCTRRTDVRMGTRAQADESARAARRRRALAEAVISSTGAPTRRRRCRGGADTDLRAASALLIASEIGVIVMKNSLITTISCARHRRVYFWQLFGACRRRTPRARSNRRVASERARSALSDAPLRFDLALGVRRRYAPKGGKKKMRRQAMGTRRAPLESSRRGSHSEYRRAHEPSAMPM